ncbi:hypothetical protein RA29_04030 [Tateyamaria sp. ANG-S1]|nr:hypothetical protein RA29_04030 [Tateyamaria sp. ANG-S1]
MELVFAGLDCLLRLGATLIPGMAEHGLSERNELLGGLQRFDHLTDIALDFVPRDGFTVAFTVLRLAKIIGVVLGAPFGPG